MTTTPLPLTHETDGPCAGIYTLTLEQAGKPVVVLDHALIQQLEATLALVPASARGLVLRSASERVFVAGADLKAISELDDAQLDAYLQYGSKVFGMLGQLPCPTVAAINGAALGGGLELAMQCDGLIGAPSASGKPYPVGLPEAGLKICPGWGGTNMLAARIDPEKATLATMSGTTMMVDDAKAAGLFDAFAPDAASLLDTAKKWLCSGVSIAARDGAPSHWIGRVGSKASNSRPDTAANTARALASLTQSHQSDLANATPAGSVLCAVNDGLARGWQAALATERRELIRLRNAPAGKAAISAFLNKGK